MAMEAAMTGPGIMTPVVDKTTTVPRKSQILSVKVKARSSGLDQMVPWI